MHVELRNIEDITPYSRNPRKNDHAVDAVAKSIREFGFNQPLVLDKHGEIIVGDTRYKAARKLGLKQVPVMIATHLSPEQIKAYRIADNKLAELADWDHDRLVQELAELEQMAFNLELVGFEPEELQAVWEGNHPRADRSRRHSRAARCRGDPARRPLPPGRSPPAMRRCEQRRRRGSFAGRLSNPSGAHGSALQRSRRTSRRAFLMEIDPLYCDVVVRRFEQFTGKKAERQTAT
jgi:hypothetical protein